MHCHDFSSPGTSKTDCQLTEPHRVQSLRKKRHRLRLLLTCLAVIATTAPATAETPFSLWYSLINPGTNGQFPAQGARVAISANFAVAAAITGYGNGGSQAVSVYDSTNGVLRYTLLNPGQPSSFGSCLAVSGTRVIVGDQDAHPTYNEGCVYVYDLASVKPTTPVLTLFTP